MSLTGVCSPHVEVDLAASMTGHRAQPRSPRPHNNFHGKIRKSVMTAVFRLHTVRFLRVTLDEMGHSILLCGIIGKGLENIWSEYLQFVASPFGEKLKKPKKMTFLANYLEFLGLILA